MNVTLIIIAVIIAGVLLYLVSLEGKYEVRRSLCMNVDKEAVFRKLCDFKSWVEWSPWLIHELTLTLTSAINQSRKVDGTPGMASGSAREK